MKRRTFLETLPTVGVGLGLWSSTACNLFSNGNYKGTQHVNLRIISSNPINIPQGKRVAFGWSATGIRPNDSIVLKPEKDLPEANLFLRISTAQETWDKTYKLPKKYRIEE